MTTYRIGLIGGGISTSLSPVIHRAESTALGLRDYRYDLLDIEQVASGEPSDGIPVLRAAVTEGFNGFNVTHPCKQSVIGALDGLDPLAERLGAVNTITVDADGRLVGHNTDHAGFLDALSTLAAAARDDVVLVGAGGAGRAVADALAAAGARRIRVSDLDAGRAREVADRLAATYASVTVEPLPPADVTDALGEADGVVNASPRGMEGHDGDPFDLGALRPHLWVADIVYRPIQTRLLRAAAHAGCHTVDGTHMLVGQAAETLALVTGMTPDRERMRRHLRMLLDDHQASVR